MVMQVDTVPVTPPSATVFKRAVQVLFSFLGDTEWISETNPRASFH